MTATIAPSHPFLVNDGQNLVLFPPLTECTVSQAAQFLRVSENYVNELLKDDTVASRTVNGECLIQWDSLSAFEQRRACKLAGLAEIVRMDQEMGLYDD